MKNYPLLAKACCLFLTLLALTANATTYTWTGAGFMGDQDFLWSNPFNWNGLAAPSAGEASVTLVFPNTSAPRKTTNDIAGLTVATIQFQGDDYVVYGKPSGNALGLYGAGAGGFTVMVSGGNCQFATSCPMALSNAGSISVSSGETFTLSSKLSGPGGYTKYGAGTLRLNAPQPNTYSGTTLVYDGTLYLENGIPATGQGYVSVSGPLEISTGAQTALVRLLLDDQIADSSAVTLGSQGALWLNGHDDTIGSLTVSRGAVVSTGVANTSLSPGLLTLNGNVTSLDGNGSLPPAINGRLSLGAFQRTFTTEESLLVSASISGNAVLNSGLTKAGPASLYLSGATNSYTGPTYVSDGTLVLQGAAVPGATNGGTVVSTGARLALDQANVGNEQLTLNGGSPYIFGFNATNSWAGPITLVGVCDVDATFGFATAEDHLTLSGPISGTGALRKPSFGTLRITGSSANTFTGGLIAEDGFVYLEKSANASAVNGAISVGRSNVAVLATHLIVGAPNQIPNNVPVTILNSGALSVESGANETLGNVELAGGILTSTDYALLLGGNVTNRSALKNSSIWGTISLSATAHYFHSDHLTELEVHGVLGGPGTVILTGGTGMATFFNTNTYAGLTLVKEGTLKLMELGRPGASTAGTVIEEDARLLLSAVGVTNETLTLEAGSLPATLGNMGTSRWEGPVILSNVCEIEIYGVPSHLTVDGPISGNGSLRYESESFHFTHGTLVLEGDTHNTFTGAMLFEAGTLVLRKTAGVHAIPGDLVIGLPGTNPLAAAVSCEAVGQFAIASDPVVETRMVTINSGAQLQLNGYDQQIANLILREANVATGNGTLWLQGDILVEPGTGASGLFPGISFLSGNLRLVTPIATSHDCTVLTDAGLLLSANVSETGPGTLFKKGDGLLALSGSNSFVSYLILQAGKTLASGQSPFGSAVRSTSVESGATLVVDDLTTDEPLILAGSGLQDAGALMAEGANLFTGAVILQGEATVDTGTNATATFAGMVSGNGGLLKTGVGTVRFSGTSNNSYTGATTVKRGYFEMAKTNAIAVPGALDISDRIEAALRVVRWFGPNQVADTSAITLDDSAIANLNGFADTIGSLTGSGQFALGNGTLTTGADNTSTSFDGVITGLGGALAKTGTGTFSLQANNTYGGLTTVNGGTLLVNGQQSQSAVSLVTGGQLGGVGRVGNLSAPYGHLAPGGSPGILVCNNYSTFSPANLLKIDIAGPTPGTGYDQLEVHGSVLLMGGILQLSMTTVGAISNHYVIVSNDGADPVSGTFTSLSEGATLSAGGASFTITYHGGDGNDVVLIQQTLGTGNAPKLSGVQMLADGTFQISGNALPNTTYRVEAAPSLAPPIDWQAIGTTTSDAAGLLQFIDVDAPNYPIRFYRFQAP